MKINESNIQKITLSLCLLYFLFSIIQTIYDVNNLKHEDWKYAENQSTIYSSRRSTTVTYNFIKDGIRITRKYPGILEGLNTWMWDIDKNNKKVDISFFIRNSDYERMFNNKLTNRKDVFGNELNELEGIPFFGLREINIYSNKLLLILDVWKYNYNILIAFNLLILPYFIVFVLKKIMKVSISKNNNSKIESKIGGYMIFFFILLFINLIV